MNDAMLSPADFLLCAASGIISTWGTGTTEGETYTLSPAALEALLDLFVEEYGRKPTAAELAASGYRASR